MSITVVNGRKIVSDDPTQFANTVKDGWGFCTDTNNWQCIYCSRVPYSDEGEKTPSLRVPCPCRAR